MIKKYIYIAGPLFTEADRVQRLKEEDSLDKLAKDFKNDIEFEIFNPLTFNKNNNALKNISYEDSSVIIFNADFDFVRKANVYFFDIAKEDSGTMVELGNAIYKKDSADEIKLFVIDSDFRKNNEHQNKYVLGAVLEFAQQKKIFKSFDDALNAFNNSLKEELK